MNKEQFSKLHQVARPYIMSATSQTRKERRVIADASSLGYNPILRRRHSKIGIVLPRQNHFS